MQEAIEDGHKLSMNELKAVSQNLDTNKITNQLVEDCIKPQIDKIKNGDHVQQIAKKTWLRVKGY